MKRLALVCVTVLLAGMLAACGLSADEVAATYVAQTAAAATDTPKPTATPKDTPTPTPVPVSAFIPDTPIISAIEFDSSSPLPGDWWFGPNVSVQNGLLTLKSDPDWGGVGGGTIRDGQTVLVQFRYRQGASVEIGVETGEDFTPSSRWWMLAEYADDAYFRPKTTEGSVGNMQSLDQSWISFNMTPVPDRWYIVLIHVGGSEEFVIRLWDQEDPTLYRESRITFPEGGGWANRRWRILFIAGPGYGENPGFDVDRIEFLDGLPDLSALTASESHGGHNSVMAYGR